MRGLVMVGLLALAGCASVQMAALDQSVEKRYDVPKVGRLDLYDRSQQWIAANFKSAKAVLEYGDRQSGTIIGNGVLPYACEDSGSFQCGVRKSIWNVRFTFRVDVKDERLRVVYSNIRVGNIGAAAEVPTAPAEDRAAVMASLGGLADRLALGVIEARSGEW